MQASYPDLVKSVQLVSANVVFATTDHWYDVTINAVDTGKTICQIVYQQNANSALGYSLAYLTSSTNCRIGTSHSQTTTGSLPLWAYVIEFYPDLIKSLQIVAGGAANNTITSVAQAKSFVVDQSMIHSGGASGGAYVASAYLSSATNLVLTGYAALTGWFRFAVVECY